MPEGGKFPFGFSESFKGAQLTNDIGKVVAEYWPNPKQFFAHNCCADEVFFGGAIFGGKSWYILWHNALHCIHYGEHANTVLFRRTFDELEGSLILDQKDLFADKFGTYNESKRRFTWDNGAITWFRHLEDEEALRKHQSRQYTLVGFDELTHFEQGQYTYLFQRLRSPRDPKIHPQIISASNPRGPGHRWVYERFIKDKEPLRIYNYRMKAYKFGSYEFKGRDYRRVFVPSTVKDNIEGLKNDPEYLPRLALSQPPNMYKAFVEGNWEEFEAMAFPEWRERLHVVEPFTIPRDWKVIRSLDWGYSSPFSVGWLAQDPDSKAIYRIAEWFGARKGPQGGITGLRMSVEDVKQGILDRERAATDSQSSPQPWYGVADPSIWQRTTGEKSVGDIINAEGALFRAANRDRMVGKQVLHSRLRLSPSTGKPGFFVFNTCKDFIDQMSQLVLEEKHGVLGEDVDTNQQDHIYDENRYGMVELTQAPAHKERGIEAQAAARYGRRPVLV